MRVHDQIQSINNSFIRDDPTERARNQYLIEEESDEINHDVHALKENNM